MLHLQQSFLPFAFLPFLPLTCDSTELPALVLFVLALIAADPFAC
jgi:hypothetical protein